MNCTEAKPLLFAFAAGKLGVEQRCQVFQHLNDCPACAGIVADQLTLRCGLGQALFDEPTPVDLLVRIRQQMASEQVRRWYECYQAYWESAPASSATGSARRSFDPQRQSC